VAYSFFIFSSHNSLSSLFSMAAACQIFISLFLYAFACVTAATLPTATVNSTTPEFAKVRPVEYQN